MNHLQRVGLGISVLAAFAGAAQGKPPTTTPTIQPAAYYDSAGQFVGLFTSPLKIMLRMGDDRVILDLVSYSPNVGSQGVDWTGETRIYFGQLGCVGQAYLDSTVTLGFPAIGVVAKQPAGSPTLYVARADRSKTTFTAMSSIYQGQCVNHAYYVAQSMYAVTATYALSQLQPPFFVR